MNSVLDTEVFVNSKSHEYNNRNANSLNMQHLQNYWGIFINKITITHSSLNITILQPNFYKMLNEHIFKLFLKTQRNHESSQKLSKVMVMVNSHCLLQRIIHYITQQYPSGMVVHNTLMHESTQFRTCTTDNIWNANNMSQKTISEHSTRKSYEMIFWNAKVNDFTEGSIKYLHTQKTLYSSICVHMGGAWKIR